MNATKSIVRYEVSPLFRVEREHESGALSAVTGQGSSRQMLTVGQAELFEWLLSRSDPAPHGDLRESLRSVLGVDLQQADDVMALLVEAGALISAEEASLMRAQGARWEEWGWRDAYDFHWACRELEFDGMTAEEYQAAIDGFLAEPDAPMPQPGPYKELTGDTVALKQFVAEQDSWRSVGDSLLNNWPVGRYQEQGLELRDLAQILRFSFGVVKEINTELGTHLLKPTPSGGARHPVEVYVASRYVKDLPPGIYHYQPKSEVLTQVNDSSALAKIDDACFQKEAIKTASAVVFLTVRWLRHSWKYRYSRSYRMVLMEIGHTIQTACLAGTLLDVPVYSSHAIHDDMLTEILALGDDCEESPMYAFAYGRGAMR